MAKVGLGGGCHWCTEAVFQSLRGVTDVAQGFIAPNAQLNAFSEAVVVCFDEQIITLEHLIFIHLHTHKSTKNHSMRAKYRSAIYVFDASTQERATQALIKAQSDFKEKLITKVVPFGRFKYSDERFHNYYRANPNKPFCESYISPKLAMLKRKFSRYYQDVS